MHRQAGACSYRECITGGKCFPYLCVIGHWFSYTCVTNSRFVMPVKESGELTPSVVSAKRPRDFGDFSAASQKKINNYALAVRQGTISLNDVPESYRGATYQRIITLGTDKAAETIGKVGLNTALALSDPIGYAAGWAAQKGLAYANDAASGRNEYTAGDILGYTPVLGTEYAEEHPGAAIAADLASGAIGGTALRNVGSIARNVEQAAQNAAAVSGIERDVLSYPSVGKAKAFGTVYKSGTKGTGKTGTVRSARGASGYGPNVSAKGVFSNESSGAPSVINWHKPDAALPISPVPFNGPGVPPMLWNGPTEPQTVLVDTPEEPVVIQQPHLTIPGMSMTPEEVYRSIHGNSFDTGGPVEDGDGDFVGPPVPNSVRLSNSLKQSADAHAKKYEDAYPNIAYFLRQSGNMRGETYGANERMFMEYTPDNLVKIRGTQNHNVSVPRAYLDSLALNGAKSGVSPVVALGIPAQETSFGYYPTAAWSGQQMKEWAKMSPRGFAAENGGLTPIDLMNDSAYTNDPYTSSISYAAKKAGAAVPQSDASHTIRTDATPDQLARIEQMLADGRGYADRLAKKFIPGSVFEHAYGLYKAGNYNPGDPEYAGKVEAAGADVFASPQIQSWWNSVGRKYYERYAPTLLEGYSDGGSIHIKPSKRGTFTAAATKHGKSVQAFASQVLAHPENYSSAMVKKANFARNASKWHADGGLLERLRNVYGDDDSVRAAILRAKNVKKFEDGGDKGEVDGRIRAEMMARHSGGVKSPLEIIGMSSSPVKAFRTWKSVPKAERDVYAGAISPKAYFEANPNYTNYSGMGRLNVNMDSLEDVRKYLQVSGYTPEYTDDFVSALFNNNTPMSEAGVLPISNSMDIYGRILGKNYANVTGNNFRGYVLPGDVIPESEVLDGLVRSGSYTQKRRDYSSEYEPEWRIGNSDLYYDAGSHQYVEVEHNGKKYYKLVDVFDTKDTHKFPVARQMNEFISNYEMPYIVTTPWKEVYEKK